MATSPLNDIPNLPDNGPESPPPKTTLIQRLFYGQERNLEDPSLFHSIRLIPHLDWVGFGVDESSSSTYGPDELFRVLFNSSRWGSHPAIALRLALAITATVAVVSWSYARLIQHFPFSGGGYGVATKLLGPYLSLISGWSTRSRPSPLRSPPLSTSLQRLSTHPVGLETAAGGAADHPLPADSRPLRPRARSSPNSRCSLATCRSCLLHNETAHAITRRLQLQGMPMVVMPIRILKF